MTILNRTTLSASDKSNLIEKIALCQEKDTITALATEFSISRKAVYSVKSSTTQALQDLVVERCDENNQTLISGNINKGILNRNIVALKMDGSASIRGIKRLIPTLFPGCNPSFGYIQNVLIEAEIKAKAFNDSVILSNIKTIAVDEMYSQGEPILASICLDSGFLNALSYESSRDGETWSKVLTQNSESNLFLPECVVKDGATGIRKGVAISFPDAEQRDDIFHASYILGKAMTKLENKGYRTIESEVSYEKQIVKSKDAESKEALINKSDRAKARCTYVLNDCTLAQEAKYKLHAAFSSVQPKNGNLQTQNSATTLLLSAVTLLLKIKDPNFESIATYIKNRLKGLTLAVKSLHEKLVVETENYSEKELVSMCKIIETERRLRKNSGDQKIIMLRYMLKHYKKLHKSLSQESLDILEGKVEKLMIGRHRASSAIEGFNATLRPFLYCRKIVSQGFLELFKAWHNLKRRDSGRHKGTSAYEIISDGKVDDWLSIIGFPGKNQTH